MSEHSQDHAHELGHIVPFKVYMTVLIALLILTVVTVAAAQVDFGVLNIVVAMLIASVKAGLVALFFMHLKYENPLTWLYVIFPIILLFTLIAGVFVDNPFRISPQAAVQQEAPVADAHH